VQLSILPHPAKREDGSQIHKGMFEIWADGNVVGTTYDKPNADLIMLYSMDDEDAQYIQREGREFFKDERNIWLTIPMDRLQPDDNLLIDDDEEQDYEDSE
jgi:hypothetical protein